MFASVYGTEGKPSQQILLNPPNQKRRDVLDSPEFLKLFRILRYTSIKLMWSRDHYRVRGLCHRLDWYLRFMSAAASVFSHHGYQLGVRPGRGGCR